VNSPLQRHAVRLRGLQRQGRRRRPRPRRAGLIRRHHRRLLSPVPCPLSPIPYSL